MRVVVGLPTRQTHRQPVSRRAGTQNPARVLDADPGPAFTGHVELPDPLLPLPDATIELPEHLTGEDRLNAAFAAALDHVNLHAMAWPASDVHGNLAPPPDEHVLHDLAHAYELVDEERLLVNPRLGDVAVVSELPECDFCGRDARYDAVIEINDRRGGANLCGDHYRKYGSGTLGASGDAYLMHHSEVPAWVQDRCNQLLAAQGREPIC